MAFWKLFFRLVYEKDVFINASAITFNLFVFLIPFVLILISIVGFLLSYDEAVIEINRYAQDFFPTRYNVETGVEHSETIDTLLQPIVERRRTFGMYGFGIMILTSLALFGSLKHVLFEVFDIEDRVHPVKEFIYNFFVFGLVGGLFIFFTLSLSMVAIFTFNEVAIPFTDFVINLGWLFDLITQVIPILFTFALFFAIFRYLSEKKISLKVSYIGAFCYTILFETARLGVGVYMDYAMKTYEYVYQSYAIFIILSIWMFYSALLFVISCIVAKAYQDVYYFKHILKESDAVSDW
ncbi:MAG: YihY/virulence factor BrkB family protein [Balneolales bacterium]